MYRVKYQTLEGTLKTLAIRAQSIQEATDYVALTYRVAFIIAVWR